MFTKIIITKKVPDEVGTECHYHPVKKKAKKKVCMHQMMVKNVFIWHHSYTNAAPCIMVRALYVDCTWFPIATNITIQHRTRYKPNQDKMKTNLQLKELLFLLFGHVWV